MTRTVSRFPRLKNVELYGCFLRLTLDTRHAPNADNEYPVSISILRGDAKSIYHHLPYKLSRSRFDEICRATGRGRNASAKDSAYAIRRELESLFEAVVERLKTHFSASGIMTPRDAVKFLAGQTDKAAPSHDLMSLWDEVAASKAYNTRASYIAAKKSFIRYFGAKTDFVILPDEITRWQAEIESRAKDRRKTTGGIYMRSLRVVLNEAIRRGLLTAADYPFGSEKGVRVPRGGDRREQYLSVPQMTQLYRCFIDESYPESWSAAEKESVRHGLGLFLAQYLVNGCNLADLARIRYNDHYFSSGETSFSFIRHKTAERNYTDQEVVVPIIPPLREILVRMAAKPTSGSLVFPHILDGAKTDVEQGKRISQANQNIRKHLQKLTKALGWTVSPSGSWCRHSYATNLTHAGVPDNYIHQSMGHAVTITSMTMRYVDLFPPEMQREYNSRLLSLEEKELVTISRSEYEAFLRFIATNKI